MSPAPQLQPAPQQQPDAAKLAYLAAQRRTERTESASFRDLKQERRIAREQRRAAKRSRAFYREATSGVRTAIAELARSNHACPVDTQEHQIW